MLLTKNSVFNYLLKNQTLKRKAEVDTCQKTYYTIYTDISGKWLNLFEYQYFWILRQRARRGGGDSDDEGRSRGKKRKESSQKGERLTEKQRRKIRSKAIISSSEDSDSDGGKKLKIAYVHCIYVMVSLKVYVDVFSLLYMSGLWIEKFFDIIVVFIVVLC